MNLTGRMVQHTKFGNGEIKMIEGNKMNIQFQQNQKIFLYPDAFQNILYYWKKMQKNI